ncbi:MAG: PorT family protein, partial [Alloprevotella sp.]|nr:PorT family protein [Alloprevotella sp.]
MKKFLILLLVSAAAQAVSAQPADGRRDFLAALFADWHYQAGGGVAVGGTMPLPMPRSIRRIEAFNPLLNLYVEGLASRPVSGRWGVATGLRLERKGMK